jgi:hypothetical protein
MGGCRWTEVTAHRSIGHDTQHTPKAVAAGIERLLALGYGLKETGLLDGFFAFLTVSGIKAHWQTLMIAGVRHLFVPMLAFVLFAFGVARGCCSASRRVTPCPRCCSATRRP